MCPFCRAACWAGLIAIRNKAIAAHQFVDFRHEEKSSSLKQAAMSEKTKTGTKNRSGYAARIQISSCPQLPLSDIFPNITPSTERIRLTKNIFFISLKSSLST